MVAAFRFAKSANFAAMTSVALALAFLPMCASAGAHEIETGTALICDTQKQAERLVSFLESNAQNALNLVNTEEHDPTACASATVAYIRGGVLGTVRNKSETYQIVELLIVGVATDRGIRSTAPATYVSLFKIDERAA
jgi:hypothetical protein